MSTKTKKPNRALLVSIFKYYFQTVGCATAAVSMDFLLVCVFRNLLGEFRKYFTIFIPSILAMQMCWFFPVRVLRLFTTATSQATLAAVLRQFSFIPLVHLAFNSSPMRTLLFMINSAIILHYKRCNQYKEFWFISPHDRVKGAEESRESEEEGENPSKCSHRGLTCRQFVTAGMRYYLRYGLILDLVTFVMGCKVPDNWRDAVANSLAHLRSLRLDMTAFFLCYVGIYRSSLCLLRRYMRDSSPDIRHFVAAFLGGSAYWCSGKVTVFTMSAIIAIQILWQQFCKRPTPPPEKSGLSAKVQFLKHLPAAQIIFPFNIGYLTHNFICNNHLIDGLGRSILNALTNYKIQRIHDALVEHTEETILREGTSRTIKVFP